MNHCVTGWHYFSNPRMFPEYGRQKGWEREAPATDTSNGAEKFPEGFVAVSYTHLVFMKDMAGNFYVWFRGMMSRT